MRGTKYIRDVMRAVRAAGGQAELIPTNKIRIVGPLGIAYCGARPGSTGIKGLRPYIRTHTGLDITLNGR